MCGVAAEVKLPIFQSHRIGGVGLVGGPACKEFQESEGVRKSPPGGSAFDIQSTRATIHLQGTGVALVGQLKFPRPLRSGEKPSFEVERKPGRRAEPAKGTAYHK